MDILQGVSKLETPLEKTVITIGNFDGMHKGHQALLQELQLQADKHQASQLVMTFRPHPVEILRPEVEHFELFSLEDLKEQLVQHEIDYFVVEPFDTELARVPAKTFFENWLVKPFHPKAIVVGFDFHFGAERGGDAGFLRHLALSHGIEIVTVPPQTIDGERISSTRIRKVLGQGRVDLAAQLLGRPYYLQGTVVAGHSRGKDLGFATANIHPDSTLLLKNGVYFTMTEIDGRRWPSVTNVGTSPTFDDKESPKVETHILQWQNSLYERKIRVHFLQFWREPICFASSEELAQQISRDVQGRKSYLWQAGSSADPKISS